LPGLIEEDEEEEEDDEEEEEEPVNTEDKEPPIVDQANPSLLLGDILESFDDDDSVE